MQRFLTFAVAILIIYTVVTNKMVQSSQNTIKPIETTNVSTPDTKNESMSGNFLERSLSNVLVNILKTQEGRTFFENMIQPMDGRLDAANTTLTFNAIKLVDTLFQVRTEGEGSIGPSSCGHTVTVQYSISATDQTIIEEGTKTFILGANNVIPALENIVVGMYIGQTRDAVTISKYAYDNPQFQGINKKPAINYKIKVTLLDIEPKSFIVTPNTKIFDDTIAYQMPCLCGEHVAFNAKISKIDGTLIYDSSSKNSALSIRLGDNSYPMAFSYSLFGKIPNGSRTVLIQGKYLQPIDNKDIHNLLKNIKISDNEFYIIELNNVSIK